MSYYNLAYRTVDKLLTVLKMLGTISLATDEGINDVDLHKLLNRAWIK